MPRPRIGLLFLLPGMVFMLALMGYPVGFLLVNSLREFNFLDAPGAASWVGLRNFVELLQDDRFWQTMGNTAVFTAAAVGVELILGFAIALLFNAAIRGRRLFVALLILPTAAMPVAVGLIWRYMYNHEYGLISYFLKQIGVLGEGGLIAHALLTRPGTAMASIIVTDVWEWTPFVALVLLGGLMSLPKEPFEAARIDGASWWQSLRYVTIPLLRPLIAIALLIRISDAVKVFDIVYVLTGGGPGVTTETAHIYAYRLNFKSFEMGYGSAHIVVFSLLVLLFSVPLYRRVTGRR